MKEGMTEGRGIHVENVPKKGWLLTFVFPSITQQKTKVA